MASGGAAVEIHGAKELRRSLRKAGADLKQMREVNKAAGEIVARAARGIAVVDDGALVLWVEGFDAPLIIRKSDGGYG